MTERILLAAHGGAGNVGSGPRVAKRLASLESILTRGFEALSSGESALDVVEQVVMSLEDDPEFNAGCGSVLTCDGIVEMDAAIMDGAGRRAGAVAALQRLQNPIAGARLVLERSPHVLLVGSGAESFCFEHGARPADPKHLVTEARRAQWERARAGARISLDHDEESHGTVGAVALDQGGHLAAATSTGGMTNQHGGRVGDSPIIGAGTWADDASCAVSATGDGEAALRSAFANGVHARILREGKTLARACELALAEMAECGGRGGCIAINPQGEFALPFNTPGMYRGVARTGARVFVAAGKSAST